jgi:ATP-dependent DNA helicase RecG
MISKMTEKDLALLIREGESLVVEFKEKYTSRIDEDIVAFANTRGGRILLGVRDVDGKIVGEMLTNDLKARINSLARNCKPGVPVSISRIGEVIAVEIAEGDEKPYGCASGYYRRLDGMTQKMSHEEVRLMFRENDPLPFEERTVKGFSFDDVSREKVLAFAKAAGVSIGKTATADFLRSLKVADGSKVVNAGILFFAEAPQDHIRQAQMTLIAFKGTDRVHIYDRIDVRNDLPAQFNQAIRFLEKHLNVRSEIRRVDREDIYEIPFEALREGLLNALMHRDYSITGTQVSVDVFDDRVEMTNPGGLARGFSRQALGKGISIRRNELIADLFSRIHKVERAGTGIRRMRRSMAKAGLKEPEFEINGFFRAVFHRSPEFSMKGPAAGSQKSSQKGSQKILALLALRTDTTIDELAKELGVSSRAVKKNLHKLKEQGLLRRVGPDKGGRWEILGPEDTGPGEGCSSKSALKGAGGVDKGVEGPAAGSQKSSQKSSQKGSQKSSQKGSQKILALLALRTDTTIDELAKELGVSSRAVKKNLHKLKDQGLLRRIGPDKGGYWEILDPEDTGPGEGFSSKSALKGAGGVDKGVEGGDAGV